MQMREGDMPDVCPVISEGFNPANCSFIEVHIHAQKSGEHANEQCRIDVVLNTETAIDEQQATVCFDQETVQNTLSVWWEKGIERSAVDVVDCH
jgi:hypothetical protein